MAAPVKPWERAGVVMDHAKAPTTPQLANIANGVVPSVEHSMIQGSGRPPVPPRLDNMGVSSGAGSLYGTGLGYTPAGFNGMYSAPYMAGGMGAYSPYSRIGMGYGSNMTNTNSSLVQQAEYNAQGAFQSVESVVSAVSSISMMLESTYMALHNSFRAVLGVADQFSRLRVQLTQVAATFAVFRFLRWLYRRLMVLIGMRKAGLPDDAWANAMKQTSAEAQQKFPGSEKSSWPLIVFMAITFGGPYLIWRMLKNIAGTTSNKKWANGTSDHVVGECKFDFTAERPDELTVTTGQRINLAPAEMQPRLRQNDWLLASADGENVGMVPASYVRILGTRKGQQATNMTKTTQSTDTEKPLPPAAPSNTNTES